MTEWFKVFGLSFFNDKLAAKSANYGFASVVLTILLSFVFFMFGFMAADVVPFSTHYDNANKYKEFVHQAVSSDELKIEIKDGLANSNLNINTYVYEDDRENYALNGYNFIIDTRASDALIEFSQVALKDGEEKSYEEYLNLSDKEKENYSLEYRYTDKLLELNAELTAKHESYLDGICEEGTKKYNKDAAKEYKSLKDSNLSEDEYGKQIYFLYVKYYFTNFESALMSAKAPVLCDYYYLNFVLGDNKNYFYLLDDICIGSFQTDNGIPAVFTGYYKSFASGTLNETNVDGFIKDVFYDSVHYSMSSYFSSAMQMAPGYILIPVLTAFILFLIDKAGKKQPAPKFTDCYKIVNSFVWFSAFIMGLLIFILGFFLFARKLYLFMPLIFALILFVRVAVFCILSRKKKAEDEDELISESF